MVFPVKEHCVALYLQHLGDRSESKSAVEKAVNTLNLVHSLAGVKSPTHSPLVQATAVFWVDIIQRELLEKKLGELGHPSDKFGLHSLRAGEDTAVANPGVQDCLFKRHGRWRSDDKG